MDKPSPLVTFLNYLSNPMFVLFIFYPKLVAFFRVHNINTLYYKTKNGSFEIYQSSVLTLLWCVDQVILT